jgi:hypothetical protein
LPRYCDLLRAVEGGVHHGVVSGVALRADGFSPYMARPGKKESSMSTFLARCLLMGAAVTLAAAPPAWAQSSQDASNRSNNAQPENQTTSDSQQAGSQQSSSQPDSQQSGQNWQNNQQNEQSRQTGQDDTRGGFFGRNNDEQNRRTERQEQRQDRRQESGRFDNRDRQPAIGVTVVERGGMGVRVMAVVPNSPASEAGIQPGDTILEVEGRRVDSAQQLVSLIQNQEAGETAEFAVIREGREYQVPVRLSTRERALPARLRQADSSQGQQNQQYGQTSQSWQQDPNQRWQQGQSDQQSQYGQDQSQQYGQQQYSQGQYGQQQGQYDQSNQYQQRRQYDQGQTRYRPPQPPSQYAGGYNQDSNSTQQAYYPGQDSNTTRQSEYMSQDDERQPIGQRLVQRLTGLESRLERLAQRLEQLESRGGVRFSAGSTDESHENDDTASTDTSEDSGPDQESDDQNQNE